RPGGRLGRLDVTATRRPEAPAGAAAPAVQGTGSAFAGLATRMIAFAADALVIDAVVLFVALVVAAGMSLLHVPQELRTIAAAIGAGLALGWAVSYFVFFWAADGQTPGNRMLCIRV